MEGDVEVSDDFRSEVLLLLSRLPASWSIVSEWFFQKTWPRFQTWTGPLSRWGTCLWLRHLLSRGETLSTKYCSAERQSRGPHDGRGGTRW